MFLLVDVIVATLMTGAVFLLAYLFYSGNVQDFSVILLLPSILEAGFALILSVCALYLTRFLRKSTGHKSNIMIVESVIILTTGMIL